MTRSVREADKCNRENGDEKRATLNRCAIEIDYLSGLIGGAPRLFSVQRNVTAWIAEFKEWPLTTPGNTELIGQWHCLLYHSRVDLEELLWD